MYGSGALKALHNYYKGKWPQSISVSSIDQSQYDDWPHVK